MTTKQEKKLAAARSKLEKAQAAHAKAASEFLEATRATPDEIQDAVIATEEMLDDDRASESWDGTTDSWDAILAEQVLMTREFEEEELEEELAKTRIPQEAKAETCE